MPFNLLGFFLGRAFGQRAGLVNQSSLNRVALVGGVVGPSLTGLIVTSVVARREAESIPPALVAVPDVITQPHTLAQAQDIIGKAGLLFEVIEQLIAAGPEIVIAQDPNPGTPVEPGSTVTLTVNKLGVSVPDVINFIFSAAQAAIEKANLTADEKPHEPNGSPEFTVFQTDPPRFTLVAPNSKVAMFVSSGPPQQISKRPAASAS